MPLRVFIFTAVALSVLLLVGAETPTIALENGEFEGRQFHVKSTAATCAEFDGRVDAFYGVPFADQPRIFEKPQKPTRSAAKRDISSLLDFLACEQIDLILTGGVDTTEDCLRLGIMKPSVERVGGYPALIVFHGGAYAFGAARTHLEDAAADFYVSHGLVYIVPQYRLGIYGFASDGTHDFAGNYAFFDALEALNYVHRNAKALNVDTHRITLFGYSAGASLVSLFAANKHTNNLFAAIILSSGAATPSWSMSDYSVYATRFVGAALNCTNPKTLKSCIGEPKLDEIKEPLGGALLGLSQATKHLVDFVPRIDGSLFDCDPLEMLKAAPSKPTLIFTPENEGVAFVTYDSYYAGFVFLLANETREAFDLTLFKQNIAAILITPERFGANQPRAVDALADFYTSGRRHANSSLELLRAYSAAIGDAMLSVPALEDAMLRIEGGSPTWIILGTFRDNLKRHYPDINITETTHLFEFPFFFNFPIMGDTNFTERDHKFREHITESVANFALAHTPNAPGRNDFIQATPEAPLRHTIVNVDLRQSESPLFGDAVKFWRDFRETFGYDLLRDRSFSEQLALRRRASYSSSEEL